MIVALGLRVRLFAVRIGLAVLSLEFVSGVALRRRGGLRDRADRHFGQQLTNCAGASACLKAAGGRQPGGTHCNGQSDHQVDPD